MYFFKDILFSINILYFVINIRYNSQHCIHGSITKFNICVYYIVVQIVLSDHDRPSATKISTHVGRKI
jgi:hypothetical protein